MFNLPGQSRPTMPPGFQQTGDNPPLFFRGPGGANLPGPIGSFARQSRRLYVGNITMEATEESITHFFNSKMTEMNLLSDGTLGEDLHGLGLKGDQPVISVHLNYEKNFAFVEVRVFPSLSPSLISSFLPLADTSPSSSSRSAH